MGGRKSDRASTPPRSTESEARLDHRAVSRAGRPCIRKAGGGCRRTKRDRRGSTSQSWLVSESGDPQGANVCARHDGIARRGNDPVAPAHRWWSSSHAGPRCGVRRHPEAACAARRVADEDEARRGGQGVRLVGIEVDRGQSGCRSPCLPVGRPPGSIRSPQCHEHSGWSRCDLVGPAPVIRRIHARQVRHL